MLNVHWRELGSYYPQTARLIADFMNSHDMDTLSAGRYELEDGCFAVLSEYDTAENRRFEAHRRMVDVQVLLCGKERILCAPLCDGTAEGDFNEQKDVGFYTVGKQHHPAELSAGSAVLLLPWDLHAPNNPDGEATHNRKIVFKIPVAKLEKCRKHRVACCGDSITFGLGHSRNGQPYPQVLARLLGDGYTVGNFGRNGATAIDNFAWRPDKHSPWIASPQFAEAAVSAPDTVLLMLGMNDSNPTHIFNEPNGGPLTEAVLSAYREGLVRCIQTLRSLPTMPSVILCQTTAMRREAGADWSADYVRDFTANLQKIRAVQQEIADTVGLPFIQTIDQMNDPAYYCDGVHLTDAGYEQLGHIVYAGLPK